MELFATIVDVFLLVGSFGSFLVSALAYGRGDKADAAYFIGMACWLAIWGWGHR
jgi:hypothetical protein